MTVAAKHSKRSGMRAATLSVCVLGAGVLGASAACGSAEVEPGAESPDTCVSTREHFTTQVYDKALQTCSSCHLPGGAAGQQGAKFQLLPESYPDFASANIAALREYVELEVEGQPVLLLKARGERGHGGGVVLEEDSEEYEILASFVKTLRAGDEQTCEVDSQLGVTLLDNRETARKAAITLAGRYPTDEEFAKVAESDEELEAFIRALTHEELFFDRLREIWNDVLLTERGVSAGAVGEAFRNAPELYDDEIVGYSPQLRNWTATSLTEEPLRFIEYVVRNDLPFSDVVTGNYLVANPFTAKTYGVPHGKPLAVENYLAWERVDFAPVQNRERDGAMTTYPAPVAGILSTPAFLTRWDTTPTNVSRKRARVVLQTFLATDILKFGQRPIDSTELTAVQNPTANSPMCSVCHVVLDPVAGGFRGYNERNDRYARFDPADVWHDDMLPPGFEGVNMPPDNYGNAIMWLGAQIPRDPRFAVSVAQVMYRGIVGEEPLAFPTDKAAPDYADQLRAYTIQSEWLANVAREFASAELDLRTLVVALVDSPYFRAKSGDPSLDALHASLGPGRLLPPEMLGRKFRATTGLYFFPNRDAAIEDERRARDGYLRNDLIDDQSWRLLYGGIDSGNTTKRTETMTPVMLAASQYAASLVACRATSYDFTKPAAERRLFRGVELTTTPFVPRANEDAPLVKVPDAEPKIRETIKALYFRLLGETVAADSEEVSQVYDLFADVWKDFEAAALEKGGRQNLEGLCVADTDWDKGVRFETSEGKTRPVFEKLRERPDKAPYEPGMRIDRDEHFTVRAWQAVMTYLLMDYRFTHE